jgi:hypothetical protein
MRGARAWLGVVPLGVFASCGSTDARSFAGWAGGGEQDRIPASSGPGGIVAVGPNGVLDASVDCPSSSFALVEVGPPWSCILTACPEQVSACARDCSCNAALTKAVDCVTSGGSMAPCFNRVLESPSAATTDFLQCIVRQELACFGETDAGAGDAEAGGSAARAPEGGASDGAGQGGDAGDNDASAGDTGAVDAGPDGD